MQTNSWERFVDALIVRRVSFVVTFFLVFLLTYAFLAWIDFLPEPVKKNQPKTDNIETIDTASEATVDTFDAQKQEENESFEYSEKDKKTSVSEVTASEPEMFPETIVFDRLDRSVSVLNPNSRLVSDLDMALLSGAVRHPDSATLEQKGTVFILAHSSYLPHVVNSNFRAFNGIQDLEWGDTVRVFAKNKEYIYRVNRVYRAEASDLTVPIAGDKNRLVLATCNSFGSVDDRYIVEADLYEIEISETENV